MEENENPMTLMVKKFQEDSSLGSRFVGDAKQDFEMLFLINWGIDFRETGGKDE